MIGAHSFECRDSNYTSGLMTLVIGEHKERAPMARVLFRLEIHLYHKSIFLTIDGSPMVQ